MAPAAYADTHSGSTNIRTGEIRAACATLQTVDTPRLKKARLEAAMVKAGFGVNQSALARAVKVKPSQINRWLSAGGTPGGYEMTNLCKALKVSPGYLFGDDEATQRRDLLELVRDKFGRSAADAIDYMEKLTDHHRSILAGRIEGWAEALLQYERDAAKGMPETQFDRDLRSMQERGLAISSQGAPSTTEKKDEAEEQAAGAASAQPHP